MFSHNGLISEKQNNNLIMIYVFAGGIFVLPHLLAKMFGEHIVIGALCFFVVAAIYIGMLFAIKTDLENSCCEKTKKNTLFDAIQIVRYTIRLIFYIVLTVSILCEGQVPFIDKDGGNSVRNIAILIPLLLVALYGSSKHIEQQGRLSEMIFPAVLFPYVMMIAFGIKEAGSLIRYFTGERRMFWEGDTGVTVLPLPEILLRCFALLTFILPAEICPWLKLKLKKKTCNRTVTYWCVLAVIVIMIVISLLMAGIYGVGGMSDEAAASIAIMRYIELPFGVLSRFDVLMVWFFMTACFAYLCTTLFMIRSLIADVVSGKAEIVLLFVIVILACVAAFRCPAYEDALGLYVVYGALVDVPLSIILPVVKRLMRGKEKKNALRTCIVPIMLVVGALMLTGCTFDIENVEQRDYATVLMVTIDDAGENHYILGIAKEHRTGEKSEREDFFEADAYDLDDLSRRYGEQKGKELSLSHLKVILTGVKFNKGQSQDIYDRFLSFITELDKENEVAATCPLLFVSEKEKVIASMGKAKEPVGTYIDQLVRVSEKNNKKVPKLMDYLKAVREDERIDVYELETVNDDFRIVSLNKK